MTLFPESILEKSARLIDACREAGLMVVTAESCTGGLIAAALTEIPGSSSVVGRGFITYANDAKAELLGVPLDAIREHGAVSEPVARAMAEGALARAPADISVGVTGIAGPTGGSPDRPVGTVQLAAARKGRETVCQRKYFDGDRTAVRLATVEAALDMMLAHIE